MTRCGRGVACLALAVVLSLLAPAAGGGPGATDGDGDRALSSSAEYMRYININGFEFDPVQGTPDLPEGLAFEEKRPAGIAYYIVQFDGPIKRVMKEDLSRTGVTILSYVSYNAFVVRADKASIERADSLPEVRWVGMFEPAYKLSPRLAEEYDSLIDDFLRRSVDGVGASQRILSFDRADEVLSKFRGARPTPDLPEREIKVVQVEISVFEEWNLPLVLDAVSRLGGKAITYSYQSSGLIRADIQRGSLPVLAHEIGVMWIDRHVPHVLYNDIARWVVQSGDSDSFATPVHDRGIYGTGQVVTVGDSGLDYEHDAFEDPEVSSPGSTHRKVTDYYVPEGAGGDSSDQGGNHGTHTSGTVAGDDGVWHVYDGDASGSGGTYGPHDGIAFDATLNMQDLSPDPYYVFPPDDFRNMYQAALDRDSWIHTNSWGSWGADYRTDAEQTDDFVWDNQDFLVVFAAGNNGPGFGALNPASAAKNLLSVGATYNGLGMEDVTYFSSRGPAADGRIKPDIMAPGYDTWSAHGNDPYEETDDYVQYSGTSMATPTVAGSCALIRQYYMDGWYPTGAPKEWDEFTPSAALIKATILNSASEMTGDGAYLDNEYWYPNNNQGWGRVNLDDALFFEGDERRLMAFDERYGLSTGESTTCQLAISDSSAPVEITLVWSDYPGTPYSYPSLVNDLDLVVKAPDGTVYLGNKYAGYNPGESIKDPTERDRLNNVESVLVITDVQVGVWTVEVDAHNTPMGPQPYALVMTGGIATERGAVSMDRNFYRSDATVTVRVVDTGLDAHPGAIDTTSVEMRSTTEDTPETITLTETGASTAVFEAHVPLQLSASPVGGDGVVQVQNLDTVNASYYDEDDGLGGASWVWDLASIDDDPPVISGLSVVDLRARACKIVWTTDEPSDTRLWYGTETPPGEYVSAKTMTVSHSIKLTRLTENQTYYFAVASSDRAGNLVYDDNSSDYYFFRTPPLPPMEDPSWEWPTFQNNPARLGAAPSDMTPPLELVWTHDTGEPSVFTSPVFSEGVLVTVGYSGTTIASDAYTGEVLWTKKMSGSDYMLGTPVIEDGVLYYSRVSSYNYSTQIVASDLHTGDVLWTAYLEPMGLWLSGMAHLAYHDGAVLGSSYYCVFALDADDGSLLWAKEEVGSENGVTVANGLVYASGDGYVPCSALDEHTGEVVWTSTLGLYPAAPVCVLGDTAFMLGSYGDMCALDAFSGEAMWSISGLEYIYFGGMASDGSALYLCTYYGEVMAVDPFSGTILWRTVVSSFGTNTVCYANGYVYCASPYEGLIILDASDGTVEYNYTLDYIVGSHPVVSENWVWVRDYGGTIHGFRGRVPVGVQVTPSFQSSRTLPSSVLRFDLTVENTGYLGEDTFDVELIPGAEAWETGLFKPDGVTPLSDTDGDMVEDTGPLGPNERTDICVIVTVPTDAAGGDFDETVLRFTSSTDTSRSKNATVKVIVPSPGTSIGPSAYESVSPGQSMYATMEVVNEGGLPDTIDIEAWSPSGWEINLLDSDGETMLTDTDGDLVPDVGVLPGLASATIVVELLVPTHAEEGSFERAIITARSSADPDAEDSATMTAELVIQRDGGWPTFRHDVARSGVSPDEYELPLTYKWASGSPDAGFYLSCPVISDGAVYYGDSRGYLRALDLGSGAEVWSTQISPVDGMAVGTPSVANGMVYIVGSTDTGGGMFAVDQASGQVRWTCSSYSYYLYEQFSAPVVALGNVYWVEEATGALFANDALTGETLWVRSTLYGYRLTGPTYWGGMLFTSDLSSGLTAFDAISGETLWVNREAYGFCTPVVSEGVLYSGGYDGDILAIDPFDGATLWTVSAGDEIYYSTPLVVNDMVIVGVTDYPYSYMRAFDRATRELVWEYSTGYNEIRSSPAYTNGMVFAMCMDGSLRGWDAETGGLLVCHYLGYYSLTSPALGYGYLVTASEEGYVKAYAFKGAGVGVSITVSPEELELQPGRVATVKAKLVDVYGNTVPGAVFQCESLNGLGTVYPLTVSGDSVSYTAGNVVGTDVIRFTSIGLEGTATVHITSGPAESLAVDPAFVSVEAGGTVEFRAEALDGLGNRYYVEDATWTASESAGTIDSDGVLTASTAAGTGTVTASYGGLTASAVVTVVPGAMCSVCADPQSATVTVGSYLVIEALASDEFGNAVAGMTVEWACSAGVLTPMGQGNCTAMFVAPTYPVAVLVLISSGDFEANVTVAVVAGGLDRIVLTPASIVLREGRSVGVGASWEDLYGNDLEEAEMDWECDIGELDVSSDGLSATFHAGGVSGQGTLKASYGSVTASAPVSVMSPTLSTLDVLMIGLGAALVAAAVIVLALHLLRRKGKGPETAAPGPPADQPPPT